MHFSTQFPKEGSEIFPKRPKLGDVPWNVSFFIEVIFFSSANKAVTQKIFEFEKAENFFKDPHNKIYSMESSAKKCNSWEHKYVFSQLTP